MGKVTTTQRSLALLRSRGYLCAITEHWNSYAKIRQDLFGFADLVGLHPQHGILAVQTTTSPNLAARLTKIGALPAAWAWSDAGGKIEIHGWKRYKAEGWQCRILRLGRSGEVLSETTSEPALALSRRSSPAPARSHSHPSKAPGEGSQR